MSWYQQALTPPVVIEATLKVGIIPSVDHAQFWWEVKDPSTGVLIAQGSSPHLPISAARREAEISLNELLNAVEELAEPF